MYSWFGVLISVAVFGTIILVILLIVEKKLLGQNLFTSYVSVLLAYLGKRLPINNLNNNAVHIAITVISFAGFVLFSIYRLDIKIQRISDIVTTSGQFTRCK